MEEVHLIYNTLGTESKVPLHFIFSLLQLADEEHVGKHNSSYTVTKSK